MKIQILMNHDVKELILLNSEKNPSCGIHAFQFFDGFDLCKVGQCCILLWQATLTQCVRVLHHHHVRCNFLGSATNSFAFFYSSDVKRFQVISRNYISRKGKFLMWNEDEEKRIAVTGINNVIDTFAGITLFSNVNNANRIDEKPQTNNQTEWPSTFNNRKHKTVLGHVGHFNCGREISCRRSRRVNTAFLRESRV